MRRRDLLRHLGNESVYITFHCKFSLFANIWIPPGPLALVCEVLATWGIGPDMDQPLPTYSSSVMGIDNIKGDQQIICEAAFVSLLASLVS